MFFVFGSTLRIYCYFGCFFFKLITTHALKSRFEYSLLLVSSWLKLFLWNWSCNLFRVTSEMVFLMSFYCFTVMFSEKLGCKKDIKFIGERYQIYSSTISSDISFYHLSAPLPLSEWHTFDWQWGSHSQMLHLKIILVSTKPSTTNALLKKQQINFLF